MSKIDTVKYIVGGLITCIVLVIIFVKSPQISGQSGGAQASSIINSTASGVATITNAAEGVQIS